MGIEDFVFDLIKGLTVRLEKVYKKVSKTEEYKKAYLSCKDLKQKLIKDNNENDIKEFEDSIYHLKGLDDEYIYLQGLLDGIKLKDFYK